MASSRVPPWLNLPQDITAAILHKLGPMEIFKTAQLVCTQWWSLCRDPSMWRCIQFPGEEGALRSEKICKYAVDWSQGQLVDVNIKFFCNDDVLLYISQRSHSLTRLQLTYYNCVSSEGIIEAVKNFPHLEELHLYDNHMDAEAIEAVGRSCPLLKSFKLNHEWNYEWECDVEARAIAQYMPELRHLQLIGNRMTNEGVQAIIDGCIHLESLDLRQCFNVNFGGDIEILCSQRIKDLRRPHEPIYDYPFHIKDFSFHYFIDSLDNMRFELPELRSSHDYPFDVKPGEDYIDDQVMVYDNMFQLHKTPSKRKIEGQKKKDAKAKRKKTSETPR